VYEESLLDPDGGGNKMGYYDRIEPHEPKRPGFPLFLIALLSAAVGGLVVLFFTPLLFRSGLIPFPAPTLPTPSYGPVQTTSVKVNSNIIDAVNKVKPAVVGVINLKPSNDPFDPNQWQQSTGSGIIFEKASGKAYVVTNNHVIEGGTKIKVLLPTGNGKNHEVDAKVLGSDPYTDLAVLEISDQYVTAVAEFGNSDTLQAGEPAIAIGNPLGLGESVTVGVISSPRRTIDVGDNITTDVIQTDAAINPGNSGGALVNIAGQVIGINSLKIAQSGVEGIGFAIPVNDARPIINSLIQYGKVPRPYLGVKLADLNQLSQDAWGILSLPNSVDSGVVVVEVAPGTPADIAGLQRGDVIVALDGNPVGSSSELRKYLYKNKKIGDKVEVTYYRNGQKRTTTVTLAGH
jgi:serine protease Do